MQFDWVAENEHGKGGVRDTKTRQLIRRRATQAAVLTRQGRKTAAQSKLQSVQPWVVGESFHSPNLVPIRDDDARTGLQTFGPGAAFDIAARAPVTPSIDLHPSNGTVLRHVTAKLQEPKSQQRVFRTSLSQSAMEDHHVRFFVAFALTDAEYLQAIASRYGQSRCLDTAIDCLVTCLQGFLAGNIDKSKARRLYSHAVRVLQTTLSTTCFSERFEMYYAIPLLVLYELLNPSDEIAYLTHGRGAVHLLHFIGPQAMGSQLDRLLLAMQSDVMVVENLRDGHVHCCAAPPWHIALLRSIDEGLPAGAIRSKANVTLNIIATALPHTFSHVENLVRNRNASREGPVSEQLKTIINQLRDWQQNLGVSLCVGSNQGCHTSAGTVLFAVFLMYKAITTRLAAAIPCSSELCLSLEREALESAKGAFQIAAKASPPDITSQTRLDLVAQLVQSIIETSEEWQRTIRQRPGYEPINPTLFTAWATRLGRRTSPDAREPSTTLSS